MRKIDIQSTGIEPESAIGSLASGPATPIDTYHRYYCGNMVYDRGERRLLTDEGYVTFAADGTPQYHFYLRDHLGNNRVVMAGDGTDFPFAVAVRGTAMLIEKIRSCRAFGF